MSLLSLDWSSYEGWILVGVSAGTLSYFSSAWAMGLAKKTGMIAHPGERQSHDVATPTGGGLGIIISVVVASMGIQFLMSLPGFWWQNMLPGVLLLAIVGWMDDKYPVSTQIRLLVQLVVSLWLLGFGWSQFPMSGVGWFSIIVVAVIWLMNLYNFMDGSNGMAGFQGVFAGLLMAIFFQAAGQYAMALLALSVSAACAGFLPLNFPAARVFMGDVASVPLGFIFASLAVYGIKTGSLDLGLSLLIMSVFIVDATLTLFARVLSGEQWYTAHAQHVYQRLIIRGWSHRQVLMVYQAINLVLVLPAILLAEMYPNNAMKIAAFTLIIMGTCWYFASRRLGMHITVELK